MVKRGTKRPRKLAKPDRFPLIDSDWTKRDAVGAIKAVFNWAKPKLVKENPFGTVKQGRGLHRRDMTPGRISSNSADNRKSVQNATHARGTIPAGAVLSLANGLPAEGSRQSELVRRKSGARCHHPQKYKTVRSQKNPEPRVIPLDPVVIRLLQSIRERAEGERVFLTHRGTPWNRFNLELRIRRARAVAGLPEDVKLYGTRHAFGTRGIVAGRDIKTLSRSS